MPRTYEDTVLVTIHGVWSDNSGLNRLGKHCLGKLPGLQVVYVNYRDQSPVNVLDESVRSVIYQSVRADFYKLVDDLRHGRGYPAGLETKLVVVAHSFGTLALVQNLLMPVRDLRVHRVVLLGSIVPRWTYWEHFIDESSVLANPPINFVRPFDGIVRRGLRVGGGLSGTRGFSQMGRHVPVDHFKIGGHTRYDPDDFSDIVKVIDGSYDPASAVSEEDFLSSLGRTKRLMLKLFRRTGVS